MGNICSKSPEEKQIQNTHSESLSIPNIIPLRRRSSSISSISSQIIQNIRDYYKFGRLLGSGQFGKVRLGFSKRDPNFQVAIKSIDKKKVKNIERLTMEIEMLRLLDHPNIIKVYESFEDDKDYHIVMELCTGRELLEYVVESGYFEEKHAQDIMKKILSIVNHMHKNGICHRDLKLENFVGINKENERDIKLVDFGLSRKFGKQKNSMSSIVGTPYYVAPEVLKGNYGEKCDLWSCGVITYMLLSGKMPFYGWDREDLLRQICHSQVTFPDKSWAGVSDDAKDLILKLMNKIPECRLTAEEALHHKWFNNYRKSSVSIEIIKSLKNFKLKNTFQKEALTMISKTLKYSQIKELNDAFYSLDRQKVGFLTLADIKNGISISGINPVAGEVDVYLKNLDINGDGIVNYSEFLIAALNSKKFLDEELISKAFRHFDAKGTGKITEQQLEEVLIFTNSEFTAQQILNELDLEKKGEISYEEFKKFILEQ
ncbi:hypothetical protein SteCoe_14583 [Stentor coeruleus]|uniref:non-specific serine/threonine protein kinase n=1 Tax=Stentor coeruleus TaxID=5963 RepID=A0A1R2C5P0_9CILI|nr:hypothetical protein SteCoe_14583 [Stentor coeruleus]